MSLKKDNIKLEEIIKWFALGYEVIGQLTAPKCNHCNTQLVFVWVGHFCSNCWKFKSFGESEKRLQYQY